MSFYQDRITTFFVAVYSSTYRRNCTTQLGFMYVYAISQCEDAGTWANQDSIRFFFQSSPVYRSIHRSICHDGPWWIKNHPTLRIRLYVLKKGLTWINPTILLWGWDWDHQTYSNREGYGSLGPLDCESGWSVLRVWHALPDFYDKCLRRFFETRNNIQKTVVRKM